MQGLFFYCTHSRCEKVEREMYFVNCNFQIRTKLHSMIILNVYLVQLDGGSLRSLWLNDQYDRPTSWNLGASFRITQNWITLDGEKRWMKRSFLLIKACLTVVELKVCLLRSPRLSVDSDRRLVLEGRLITMWSAQSHLEPDEHCQNSHTHLNSLLKTPYVC